MSQPQRELGGLPASPGIALGSARLLDAPHTGPSSLQPVAVAGRGEEAARAECALRDAAAEIGRLASSLREQGRDDEAEIVETGTLMALDPGLLAAVNAAVLERGLPAPEALVEAANQSSEAIAALDDPMLAARADDVRSVGRRAARLAAGAGEQPGPTGPAVLGATDLGPADVAEIGPDVVAVALAGGGTTAHAAIVARSLGLPMVVGAGPELLRVAAGEQLVVNGGLGTVVVSPGRELASQAGAQSTARAAARSRARAQRELPAATLDGRRVQVLANVATAAETLLALDEGAEGVGLLRTELAFLDAAEWPGEAEHRRRLEPVLAPLRGRVATVRVLDFGGDKSPPFLNGDEARGIALLLRRPEALSAQLRAILAAGRGCELRILLPMVNRVAEVRSARALLDLARDAVPDAPPALLGAMIETPEAAASAALLAREADFLSIGTNDLTAATLGRDRFRPGATPAYHPAVLGIVARCVRVAANAGMPLEVCGEAASDPVTAPLLVGLGVDELSVGAARVGTLRSWVRALDYGDMRALAARTLRCSGPAEVATLLEPVAERLRVLELGDAQGEGVDGAGGVVTVGSKP